MEKYKPHEVRIVRCKTCGELLLKLYPWAYVDSAIVGQGIRILCGRCSNRAIEKHEKEKRKKKITAVDKAKRRTLKKK